MNSSDEFTIAYASQYTILFFYKTAEDWTKDERNNFTGVSKEDCESKLLEWINNEYLEDQNSPSRR